MSNVRYKTISYLGLWPLIKSASFFRMGSFLRETAPISSLTEKWLGVDFPSRPPAPDPGLGVTPPRSAVECGGM